MTEYIVVRLRKGKRLHLITAGAESPRVTLCGRDADAAVIEADGVTCNRCVNVWRMR